MRKMYEEQAQVQSLPDADVAVSRAPPEIGSNDLGSVALSDLLNQISPQVVNDFSSETPEIIESFNAAENAGCAWPHQ